MIGSRAIGLLKNISRCPSSRKFVVQQIRQSSHEADNGWCYRTMPEIPKWSQRGSTVCAVICYWWFYWNLYHGWPHLVGLYDGEFLPNPRNWTDEELGIPPDDA